MIEFKCLKLVWQDGEITVITILTLLDLNLKDFKGDCIYSHKIYTHIYGMDNVTCNLFFSLGNLD